MKLLPRWLVRAKPDPFPSEAELLAMIDGGLARLDRKEQRLFEAIRIKPAKWAETPYGDDVGGFWAVGILGRTVLWYNSIEEGFNTSRYVSYGRIGEYWCNQDDLDHAVRQLMCDLDPDYSGGHCKRGPPQPLDPW